MAIRSTDHRSFYRASSGHSGLCLRTITAIWFSRSLLDVHLCLCLAHDLLFGLVSFAITVKVYQGYRQLFTTTCLGCLELYLISLDLSALPLTAWLSLLVSGFALIALCWIRRGTLWLLLPVFLYLGFRNVSILVFGILRSMRRGHLLPFSWEAIITSFYRNLFWPLLLDYVVIFHHHHLLLLQNQNCLMKMNHWNHPNYHHLNYCPPGTSFLSSESVFSPLYFLLTFIAILVPLI